MLRRLKHHPVDPKPKTETASNYSSGVSFHEFSIAQIRSATRNFNKSLLIGKGAFGKVYKGTIKNGTTTAVAVKRWNSEGARRFRTEVRVLQWLRHHTNIVCVIGFCSYGKKNILVYEYLSNGSLGEHLHKHRSPLSWSQRLKICIDVARAIDYIHNGKSGKEVIHFNVTSSNILLDNQWTAKITDFKFSKIIRKNEPSTNSSLPVVGTTGYIDPEYISTGRPSKKSDVYSFGVVLLEVLCRRRATDNIPDVEQSGLVGWAQDCLRKRKLEEIIDPDLRGQISLKCLNDYARLVEFCLRGRQELRSTMAEVVVGLESILASHERTLNSISQMGMTTFDKRLQNYFFSSELNSGRSYYRKDITLLSAKIHGDKGTYGNKSDSVSETDADVIVEESLQPGIRLKHEISNCGDNFPDSSPKREVNDGQFLFGDETKSLYELTRLEYIQQADALMRVKDFLHLLWFYPMKKEADINFGSLLHKFSSLNEYIRKSLDSSGDGKYLKEIRTFLLDIEELLNDAAFDMVPYVPNGLVQNRSGSVEFENLATGVDSGQVAFASYWSHIPEIYASAVVSATHRAVSCIKDFKVKKMGISGSAAEELAETLKGAPELRRVYDMVLCVRVKHRSIEEVMNSIEEEVQRWKKRRSEIGNKKMVVDHLPNCLLFIDCSDEFIDLNDPEFNLSKWFGAVQIVMTSGSHNAYCPVDMEIRVDDHLLPWILFYVNADLATVDKYSSIQQMATGLILKCHGHLLAIILLARALRRVEAVDAWEHALQELALQQDPSSSSSQLGVTSDHVMVMVLRFIWSRMEKMSQRCILHFALHCVGSKVKKSSLIYTWIGDGLIKSEQEGEHTFEVLMCSFLLEEVGETCIRMREETRVVLVSYFVPRAYGLYLKQDGSESNRMPKVEEWDAREIHLSNNILSEVPETPNCPILVNLFLQFNQDLMDIPIRFFDNMPSLEVLDLSGTSIKCLPSSISKLTSLRKLFIRDCDLLTELPSDIGALKNLKVFDSEGTQLVFLHEQFGSLTKLECLKFSLYKFDERHDRIKQSMHTISAVGLSKLARLKELSIRVGSYCEWREDEVKLTIDILSKVRNLESLRLHFPTTGLLDVFMETRNWEGIPLYQRLSNFCFIVGDLRQRMISRVPCDLDKTFLELPKCLKYTNGEGDTKVIGRALKHAKALLLDRHWTVRSLSSFGLAEMEKLKFCLLAECNEMRDIVNVIYTESSLKPVLGSLEHLSVHYMKNLKHIWNGPIRSGCLSNLKTLAIHTCPELRTIFTQGLLDSLTCLEYLVVEDCTTINSLVSLESYHISSARCLPSLKKISLLHLPELVSISRGIVIAPRLESLVVYDCPNLGKLSYMEFRDYIKEIKGENEWWDALIWCEPEWIGGQPDDLLASVFIPLGTEGDIMDELADAVNLLPHLSE